MHLSHQVGLDDAAEDLRGDLLEGPVGDHAGVVDPDVDPAEVLLYRPGEGLDRVLVGDVEGPEERRRATALALLRDLGELVGRARAERQRPRPVGEPQRRGAADPARGAGYHHHRLLQRSRHGGSYPSPFSSAAL